MAYLLGGMGIETGSPLHQRSTRGCDNRSRVGHAGAVPDAGVLV